MRMLWISCIDSNWPWGAETAMLKGFNSVPPLEVVTVDYRLCKQLSVDTYRVCKRYAEHCDCILIQRGEGLDLTRLATECNKPIFYFATEGDTNKDQLESFKQLLGKAKLFVRQPTYKQALEVGYRQEDIKIFQLGYF